MQRFKQQVDQLQHHLAGLTRGQKLFAVVLGVAMLLAVVGWIRFAPAEELVPLFDEPTAINPEQITSALASRTIPFEIQDGQVYVPARVHGEAIAALAWDRLLPSDAPSTLDEAIDKIGSFDVRQKIDARLNNALREELRQNIENLPGVASASVILNTVYKRQIGESLLPSASVAIKTSSPTDVHDLAQAVSCLVARAVSALEPENVAVVIDGNLVSAGGDEALASRDLRDRIEEERRLADRVREALGLIPGLVASVTVEMAFVQAPAPMPIAVEPVDAMAQTASTLVSDDRPLSLADIVTVLGKQPPGNSPSPTAGSHPSDRRCFMPTGGSLVVPMSWIVQQWQRHNRTFELPPEDALREFQAAKLIELKRVAATNIGGISSDDVTIIVDSDGALAGEEAAQPMPADNPEDSPAISALVSNWGREVAVAALGAVSVLLISAMLKKAPMGGVVVSQSALAFAPDGIDPAALEHLFDCQQVLEPARSMTLQDPSYAATALRS